MALFLRLILLFYLHNRAQSESFTDCGKGNTCECVEDGSCSFECSNLSGDTGCFNSTLKCRPNHPCQVSCVYAESCKGTQIFTQGATLTQVYCSQQDACIQTSLNCDDSSCSMSCPSSCTNTTTYMNTDNPLGFMCLGTCGDVIDTSTDAPTIDSQMLLPSQSPSTSTGKVEKEEGFPLNLVVIIVFGAIFLIASFGTLFYIIRKAKIKANIDTEMTKKHAYNDDDVHRPGIANEMSFEVVSDEEGDTQQAPALAPVDSASIGNKDIAETESKVPRLDSELLYGVGQAIAAPVKVVVQTTANDGGEGGRNGYERIERILKLIYNDDYEEYLMKFQEEMINDIKVFEDDQFRSMVKDKHDFWEKFVPQIGARVDFFRYVNEQTSMGNV